MIVFIGSLAKRHSGVRRFSSIRAKDIDLIASYDDAIGYLKDFLQCKTIMPIADGKKLLGLESRAEVPVEVELAWPGTTAASFLELANEEDLEHKGPLDEGYKLEYAHANVDLLLTFKLSHRYLRNSPHFLKTMRDIREFRELGATVPAKWKEWLKEREEETYWYQHPNLDRTKADFFKADGINYVYDHDSIHEAVALNGMPAYKYFAVNDKEVLSSKVKFNSLPPFLQLNATYEEASVLAIERSIVPHPGALTEKNAFLKALEKVCTSITSGWFREFSWENYAKVAELYESEVIRGRSYVQRFEEGLKNGVVKPYVKGEL